MTLPNGITDTIARHDMEMYQVTFVEDTVLEVCVVMEAKSKEQAKELFWDELFDNENVICVGGEITERILTAHARNLG
jgi:hypothetical protein